MARRIPPLNALRAFEAVARLGSIAAAAEELTVTRGAVSQSVKSLEDYLGRSLMRRTTRGLVLSDAAIAALPALSEGFDRLADAASGLATPERGGRLTISVAPSFAHKWLAPRLADFSQAHPDLDVQIHASMGLANFEAEGVDLAIRFGAGRWPGIESHLLLREEVTPVCAPSAAAQIKTPADLARFTLLHDDSSLQDQSCPDWTMWLKAANVKGAEPNRGPRFNQSSLVIEAAASGRGVALAKRALAQADIDSGRLAAPFFKSTPIEFAYWLAHPPGRARTRAARAFIAWIKAEALAYEEATSRPTPVAERTLASAEVLNFRREPQRL
ncbi:MAG TPA: transcriptional regulator GcvA [Verrucomicrobiae bacterium]|nr:transcriptional regulator GcvA [Verrucomicrobiae bacterium]